MGSWVRRRRPPASPVPERTFFDAAAMAGKPAIDDGGEERAVPLDVGIRWSGGAPLPHVIASEYRAFVACVLAEMDPAWDGTSVRVVSPADVEPLKLALLEFRHCVAIKLGSPNDEVLHGHPLYGHGLRFYGAYVVENSRWRREVIAVNRVHDRFSAERWANVRHYFLVFHDSCVEALAREIGVETSETTMRALLAEATYRVIQDE